MSYDVSVSGSYGQDAFVQATALQKADTPGNEVAKEKKSSQAADKQESISLEFSDMGKFMNYLTEKYARLRDGTVTVSGTYLRACLEDEDKRMGLEKMLSDAEWMVEDAKENCKGFQGMKINIDEKGNMESETYGASVGVNEGKRARQIAAAKSMSDIQMVMGLLEQDLSDCQSGEAKGMCDQSEIDKVKALIQKAQQKMAELSGGEGEEEQKEEGFSAFSLNLLM